MPALLSRRAVLGLSLWAAAGACIGTSRAAPFVNRTGLRSGSFVWQPNLARSGPLLVVVALREGLVHVYRGSVEIGISTCTPGARGQRPPTGLFLVESQRGEASPRSGERLSWLGTRLHATRMAGYPADRGCVELPAEFAELLFGTSEVGFAVAIAEERSPVITLERPCALGNEAPSDRCGPPGSPRGDHISLVASGADARAYLMRGSRIAEAVPIEPHQAESIRGTHVYALIGPAERRPALRWLTFAIAKTRSAQHLVRFDPEAPLRSFPLTDTAARLGIGTALQPGSSILLTDASVAHSRRGETGLVILASQVAPPRPASGRISVREQPRGAPRRSRERLTSAASLHDLFRPY